MSIGKGIATTMKTLTHCPELVASKVIMDLFNTTGLKDIVTSLLGPVHVPLAAKIQLSFPGDGCVDPEVSASLGQELTPKNGYTCWQLDGIPSAANTSRDHFRNYSILVGTKIGFWIFFC